MTHTEPTVIDVPTDTVLVCHGAGDTDPAAVAEHEQVTSVAVALEVS
ncbi:MAG: hypothetical protein ACFCVG_14280 [Kineosporiaceae bacterium]